MTDRIFFKFRNTGKMSKISVLIFAQLVVGAFLLGHARAQPLNSDQKDNKTGFEDIFTAELRAQTKNCRGRLPNLLSPEDLPFLLELGNAAYVKYIDQISLFRGLDAILTATKGENRPLSEVRCLFESPCMISRGFSGANSTLEVCTGDRIRFHTQMAQDGLMEGVVRYADGKAALTTIGVPTYTDGRSFVTVIMCMSDGSLGFMVLANRAGLSPYTRHLIKDHLDKSGFNDNFRISTAFMSSSCKNRL